ncbi:MAG: shikimate kinase [Acidobacteriota bacterium]|nr:shikimate kinase [Acidobacteriota bacterium]
MLIWLTGFMGSGKTTVGRSLSGRLGVPLVDTDAAIETRFGKTIPEIFAAEGEAQFRVLEGAVIAECARLGDAVVATGGGAVEEEANVELMLRSGRVIFLDGGFDVLRARVGDAATRPLFRDPELAERRYAQRRPAYGRCHLRVESKIDDTPAQVAERICALLEDECAT